MSNKTWNFWVKVVEWAILIVCLAALAFGLVYACDNDPAFQGSKTYTGHGGYNAPE